MVFSSLRSQELGLQKSNPNPRLHMPMLRITATRTLSASTTTGTPVIQAPRTVVTPPALEGHHCFTTPPVDPAPVTLQSPLVFLPEVSAASPASAPFYR
ncbi:zinc finger protein basonuclin-2 isoform X1 [Lates japonicus]|uniref:Zinc finger protein basonuclin-2 isoform X1 n=1 Tax=Lates japonicus TaxID=270547 RepID=A0AAD3NFY4_LATJO|nr:zinc finger protein basonuclin-2 isoform X1 [Lates japonicus]